MTNIKASVRPPSVSENIEHINDVFKAAAPRWLYKPPYGYPRMINLAYLRRLAKSPYCFMTINTICDQVASVQWEIQPVDKDEIRPETKDHIREVTEFFSNPNGNDESFSHLLRRLVRDVLEVDSGVMVKVFDKAKRLNGLMVYDGATFTKNPDMHGSMVGRDEFVAKNEMSLNAAYYQYGWHVPHSKPIPFGRREIVWLERNPRSDNYYGRSPVEVLSDVIQALVYGSTWHLEYFSQNEIPKGILSLIGSGGKNLKAFKQRFRRQLIKTDEFGDKRRYFHTIPLTNEEVKFTQLQFDANQLQIIEMQKWFIKILASCFGVTPSELGFTEGINRATDLSQSRVFKRKAIKPMLNMIEYALNTQVIPEFGYNDIKFSFVMEDLEEETIKSRLRISDVRAGIRTVNEIREEMGLEPVEGGDELTKPTSGFGRTFGMGVPLPPGMLGTGREETIKSRMYQIKKNIIEKKALTTATDLTLKPGERAKLNRIIKKYLTKKEKDIINEIIDITRRSTIAGIKGRFEDLLSRLKEILNPNEIKELVFSAVKSEFERGIEKAEKELDMNFQINAYSLDFLHKHTFENIKDMTEYVANKLRAEFERAMLNGEGINEIKARVKDVFNVADNRAEMIARTETNRISNIGAVEGYKQAGIPGKKQWIATIDERTSDICRKLHQQTVDINEHFEVDGKKFLYPPAHVNCRSTIVFIPE